MTRVERYSMKGFIKRLISKIQITNSCWIWKGRKNSGYGIIQFEKKLYLTHRVFYELTQEHIPSGMEIDHLCKNTLCLNPSHLDIVTHRENVLRSNSVSGVNSRKTLCPNGHPYDEFETGRRCSICRRIRKLKDYYKNRDKILLVSKQKFSNWRQNYELFQ